jgi:hypothetical protein
MACIDSCFKAGVVAVISLSSAFVQAQETGRLFDSPAREQVKPPASAQPAPPTAFRGEPGSGLPDLYVHEYSLTPSTPDRRTVVEVRIGIFNQGDGEAGPFTVQWWPGDNYPKPGCTWRVEGLVPSGGRILQCSGYVYPGAYGRINTGVYVDSGGEIEEANERNNKLYREIQVTE